VVAGRADSDFASARGKAATFSAGGAVEAGDTACAAPNCVISRTACSEYGSFNALGVDLTFSPGRAAVIGGVGRASATEGWGRSGVVVTPAALVVDAASPGGARRSTCPTRITFGFSRLFHAASSR
jgi:hypothetical protein